MRNAIMLSGLFLVAALSGCLGGNDTDSNGDNNSVLACPDGVSSPFDRANMPLNVTGPRSQTCVPGQYEILDGLDIYVDIELPLTEGGQAVNPVDTPKAHLGLFLPNIPGCDFDTITDMVPGQIPGTIEGGAYDTDKPECKVPIIADAGPYYATPGDTLASEGDVPAAQRNSGRLGEWLISTFVPHGYGVAQISVMGSGLSNHCFDMFGLAEQLGVHQSIDYLGKSLYSNGNLALIGRSYDGSTPWMAAKHASPHLKTIVPISGLSGLGDLVQWNGASEARVALFQNVVYGTFGFDSNQLATDAATHATCPDWASATPMGAGAFATGDDIADMEGTYWEERHFIPGAVANYDGSLFMIHGLLDDNVDPHAGWIGELALRDKGLDVKALWGQWGHVYPDRISEHGFSGVPESIRMDWAQEMLEWFDFYLMDGDDQPMLHTQIQQLDGAWRVEESWPPADANIMDIALGTGTIDVGPNSGSQDLALGVLNADEGVLMGGFSSVTFDVTPTGANTQIYVELRDGTDGNDFGLSYGVGTLRNLAGDGNLVVPGQTMQVTMPIQLFDAVLPAGHELVLRVAASGNGFLPHPTSTPATIDLAESTLHLSTLDRDESFYFTPPVWFEEDADGNRVQKGASE